jgi:TolB protein
LACCGIVAVLVGAVPAQAAYPGKNGKIVYQSERAGQPDVWIVNGDGTHPLNLTADVSGSAQSPAFSANGKRIVFALDGKLATMNADGSNLSVTTVAVSLFSGPIFTPDGAQIVFEKQIGGAGAELEIVAADGSGTPQTLPTGGTVNTQDISPAFSPNGNQLAFSSNRAANVDLYLAAGNGSGAVNFSNRPTFNEGPDFSPDGSRILWENSVGTTNTLLVAPVSPLGVTPTAIPASGPIVFAGPVFSPDGKRVAYTSTANGGDEDILSSALDGSNVVDVSDVKTSDVASDSQPSWAPLTNASRKLTLGYKRRKARLQGKLTSTDPGCKSGAKVKVFSKHRGKDPRVAKATTTGRGAFRAKAKHLSGTFYAAVGANARVNVANCLAAKSPKLKLG